MHTHQGTLYPMLGVGAFMTMFWTGIVLGHEIGLGCGSLLITGLLCACLGTLGVCELQRRDGQGLGTTAREPVPVRRGAARGAGTGETDRTAGERGRPEYAGIGRSLPVRS